MYIQYFLHKNYLVVFPTFLEYRVTFVIGFIRQIMKMVVIIQSTLESRCNNDLGIQKS